MFVPAVIVPGPFFTTDTSLCTLTAVMTVALSLPLLGSVEPLVDTVAVFERFVPAGVLPFTCATIVNCALTPLFNAAIVQLTVPPVFGAGVVQIAAGPEFGVTDTNVVCAGRGSVNVTSCA